MIKINNLCFSWANKPIIDIPELLINHGEHLFIEGPSGSGKSTLLNLLAGVLIPQEGEITVLDQPLNKLSGSEKDSFRANHIGFIFQQFNLIPYLSVIDNITLPCSFSKSRKNKAITRSGNLKNEAIRLLNALGLDDKELFQRSVTELSVGQQQRVAAARAMLGSPDIIIADEPTSALDNEHRQAFIKTLFIECEKENITLIFVSHDKSLKQHFKHTINLPEINAIMMENL
ncbi:methionine ABC transporter ATP-binding protein [Psychromonas sp. psych-6C06]|uniref:ABC transporter ATP-binding protein n=1 Tax=Psychromonas sp. psych-6C06 TaxID=2058089 RepID=UPI000C320B85|nr:ABC transporter ATP-binding protein [Psychromonas sp. psych-6C06]PKF62996.1 methionine ABC transporter ATP-binding protein [Psychromonas sp. psych-6C06]